MRMKVIGVLCFVFLCSATAAFAAPVNLPEGLKGKEGLLLAKDWSENVDLSVSYFYDNVFKRELAKNAGKVDFNTMGGKITLSLLNKFDIYSGKLDKRLECLIDLWDKIKVRISLIYKIPYPL